MLYLLRKSNPFKTAAKSLLVLVCALCSSTFAGKMAYSLQEAIYLFEMKGETDEAVRILEKIANTGDAEDKEDALFYLGKIQELAGNKTSANFYYNQSLDNTRETAKAYWLAEREAETTRLNENLLRKNIALNVPIQKIFRGPTTFILLQNNKIVKVDSDTIVPVKFAPDRGSDILRIDDQGIWYQSPTKDSLYYQSITSKVQKAFPIAATTSLFTHGDNALAQSAHTLTLLNKKSIKFQISEKYNGCNIEAFYPTTGHYILNCPDNSLHFISNEDANETYSITLFEPIKSVLVIKKDILLLSGNTLFCYQPKNSSSPKWKLSFSNAEKIQPFEGRIAVLEASGRVILVSRENGQTISFIRSDAADVQELAQGTLGLFTNEGALTVVDTLLRPLWHFNFAKPLFTDIIRTKGNIYLIFDNAHLQGISPHYYGKRPLQSEILAKQAAFHVERSDWNPLPALLDSIFKLEPGNAEAWLFRALFLENNKGSDKDKQKAWSEAVRHSVSNPYATPLILGRYSKAIGAKFVSLLNISPKTKYPQLFGSKKNLYTIDPAAERLICINAENGEFRWSKALAKMDNSPVMAKDENILAIVSGLSLNIHELSKDGGSSSIQLPGKAFSIQIIDNAIYVSTWNGFLLKIFRNDNKLAWSRKIFSVPFVFTKSETELHVASLDGDIQHLWDGSGQIKGSGFKILNGISMLAQADNMLAIATNNNRIYLYNTTDSTKEPVQILLESSINSLQSIAYQGKKHFLIGLADQTLLFYSSSGAPLWKFQGKNTIFNTPYVHNDIAWLDQGNEVIALSLKDGKVMQKFSTPGGAGTPFVMNRTLYSASSKRLLYGFSL